jgi:hypothetical protein
VYWNLLPPNAAPPMWSGLGGVGNVRPGCGGVDLGKGGGQFSLSLSNREREMLHVLKLLQIEPY